MNKQEYLQRLWQSEKEWNYNLEVAYVFRNCFNMGCEYNTDKNVSYVKANVTDIDWNEQSINNVQNSFQDMSNILHENSELIEMLNKNPIVISGYEWKFNK